MRGGEHVQTPGAQFAVGADADEAVCVLRAYHPQAVHRVLGNRQKEKFKNSIKYFQVVTIFIFKF